MFLICKLGQKMTINYMSDNSANNKRLVKNTILLYARMLLLMVVSLYTSRVILQALGVEDYGIYNVVGGVVAMFSIISSSLTAAIQRYITYELGKGKNGDPTKVFSTSLNIQLMLIGIMIILLETIGLWFLNYKMVIPVERIEAANFVFQFSVLTFAMNLWSIPYNACIIAHEKMSAFAYISIIEALAKLFICFIVIQNVIDRLVFYSALIFLVGLVIRVLYGWYCKKHFKECRHKFVLDKKLLREMFAFTGWNFFGAASFVLNTQGVNLLLNVYWGPIVNAARGIAVSVSTAVMGFANNFMTALNPQITKSYASGDLNYSIKLVFQGARYSYYILWVLCLPIIITTPYLLQLWLGVVPDNAIVFTRLVLICSLSDALATPLVTLMLACGNIRDYQIVVGGLQLLNLPLSWLLLKLGAEPCVVFIVAIVISIFSTFARLLMLKRMMPFPVLNFIKDVMLNILMVSFLSSVFPIILNMYIELISFCDFLLISLFTVIFATVVIFSFGCSKQERSLALRFLLAKLKRS